MIDHATVNALTLAVDFLMDKQEYDAAEKVSGLIDDMMADVRLSATRELSVDDCFSAIRRDDEAYEERMKNLCELSV